ASGTVRLRSWWSRLVVETSWGEPLGYTLAIATDPPPTFDGMKAAGLAATTSGVPATAARIRSKSAFWAGLSIFAISRSGPLYPGPKPFARRSYGLRVVVFPGSLPA